MSLNINPVNENKEKFIELLLSTKREGIDNLIKWLEKSDFFEAPSSTVFHCNYPGGLLEHSLNVYNMAMKIYEDIHELNPNVNIDENSIKIAALLHDICKTNQYEVTKKWRKDKNDKWEEYDTYIINDRFPVGHGSKSVIMLQTMIKMNAQEMAAICWHMGMFDVANTLNSSTKYSYSTANEMFPLVSILQCADFLSAMTLETTKK